MVTVPHVTCRSQDIQLFAFHKLSTSAGCRLTAPTTGLGLSGWGLFSTSSEGLWRAQCRSCNKALSGPLNVNEACVVTTWMKVTAGGACGLHASHPHPCLSGPRLLLMSKVVCGLLCLHDIVCLVRPIVCKE